MWAEVHPGIPIALPPPGLRQRCPGHCDGMLVSANPGHSSPTLGEPRGCSSLWVGSGSGLQKAPISYQPSRTCAKNDILGILWRWGDLMGCSPQWNKTQAVWKTDWANGSSQWKEIRHREKGGRPRSIRGEQKKRSHLPPRKILRCAGGGSAGSAWGETSTQTWQCQSNRILFCIRLWERKRGNI